MGGSSRGGEHTSRGYSPSRARNGAWRRGRLGLATPVPQDPILGRLGHGGAAFEAVGKERCGGSRGGSAVTMRKASVFSTVCVLMTHATRRSVLRRPSFSSPGMTFLTRPLTHLADASVPKRQEHFT